MAIAAGHVQSTCVRDRGRLGVKDWELMVYVVDGDFTLVTQNSVDFRGTGLGKPGGLYADETLHAGLICLGAAENLDIERQRDLFAIALEQLAGLPDLINQALEIYEDANGEVTSTIYEIPA